MYLYMDPEDRIKSIEVKVESTNYFIQLYMAALKAVTKNPFLKAPKEGSERWNLFDQVRALVDTLEGEYADYIQCQFLAFRFASTKQIAPKPEHMLTEKAIQRYRIHQAKKNRYHTDRYTLDGDELIVNDTQGRYLLSQIKLPVGQDALATYATALANKEEIDFRSEEEKRRAVEAVKYLLAKLAYLKRFPLDSILRLEKKLT